MLEYEPTSGAWGLAYDVSAVPVADSCILHTNGPLIPDVAGNSQLDAGGDNYGNVCDPDFDNNLIVNAADLVYLKLQFFTADLDADLSGNGIVNAEVLATLK
jgi:hypothetical protein